MNQVNIHQAKTQLSRLVALVANGEEISLPRQGNLLRG
jgi:antitoxin (DNA-binding transcriptional repressor) of toxin-antitoxin stability system